MHKEIKNLNQILLDSWDNFLISLPSLVVAFVVFILGIIVIKYLSKVAYKYIDKKSKDPLVSDFLVNIISIVFFIFLIVITLSILGWGSITNKILAGAGIGTFVIGLALKDIGENFLAGILMAFRRPFRVGDLIEIQGLKGRVTKLTLRETSIKSLDGRDIYIPNGLIVRNPLQNYTIDNFYRNEFVIGLDYDDDVSEILKLIEDTVMGFSEIVKMPLPIVFIDELATSTVNVKVQYWIQTNDVGAPGVQLRSQVMLKVFKNIINSGYKLPSDIVEVKMIENQKVN